jgi:hypothetical protein
MRLSGSDRPARRTRLGVFALAAWMLAGVGSGQETKAPRTPTKPREPAVASEEKRKTQRKGSEFLRPPGTDRYDPNAIDWSEVPPWRQTSFFGIRAQGQKFLYVVDCSGSMIDEDRLARAKEEVRRSILRLQDPQQFKVIFYNDRPLPMPGDLPRTANEHAKNQLLSWLRLIEPDGSTDPRGALSLAFSMRPDAVFLLSDGEFPEGTVEAVARSNAKKVPVHCINLGSEGGDQLRAIARDSGGRYVWRPWNGE